MVSAMNPWPPGTTAGTDPPYSPQQYAVSVLAIPQMLKLPTVSVEKVRPPLTATGTVLEVEPIGPLPQQYAVPFRVSRQVPRPPALSDWDTCAIVITLMPARSLVPWLEAVISADPVATAVTSPCASTVDTAVLPLDQVTVRPSTTLPFASRIVAVSCTFPPTASVAAFGATVSEAPPGSEGDLSEQPGRSITVNTARAIGNRLVVVACCITRLAL